MSWPVSFSDYRATAERRLPRFLFDYVDGGAFDEVTLERNLSALRETRLRQRVMTDVSEVELRTSLFGQPVSMPVMLAPIGMAGMMAPRGEAQAARAAGALGVPFCLSTVSICGIEEVAAASGRPFIFQLYMARDRAIVIDMLERAKAANCTALMLTVDIARPGFRYRDFRTGMSGPPNFARRWKRLREVLMHPRWAIDVGLAGRPHSMGNLTAILGEGAHLEDFLKKMQVNADPSLNWDDIAWIRQYWSGPIILKGILDPEDARRAADIGVEGIVVSNHGGRQLDGVSATAEMLPIIAGEVGKRLTVLVDGGVRSGLDVLRMLALGARGVMMGRPWVYALASGGGAGVHAWLRQIRAELTHAMALAGCTNIGRIGPHLLERRKIGNRYSAV
jgi:L-lactate dehydrogenase (cytochrome)